VPPGEWYFGSERSGVMPFAVLLEAALQVCGWMSSYIGSALTSEKRLHYRNLGGTATLLRPVAPASGTLRTHVETTRVSSSGGMIIQEFTFDLHDDAGRVYQGKTMFGFFSPEALAQQLGVRDATLYTPTEEESARSRAFTFPRQSPMPDDTLRMMDRVDVFVPDGGPAGLGFIQGSKHVRADEWFFEAHFYQDPVWPGSLGLEAMLQLMKVVAAERWGGEGRFVCNVGTHRWQYRGQVLPTNRLVTVQASVTAIDDERRRVTAEGYLVVDGLVIYRMSDFVVEMVAV
jgi:3-hydroxymyristoyl/3-hydroxydecanoyl-(acyl carrier protein) dehydratase